MVSVCCGSGSGGLAVVGGAGVCDVLGVGRVGGGMDGSPVTERGKGGEVGDPGWVIENAIIASADAVEG